MSVREPSFSRLPAGRRLAYQVSDHAGPQAPWLMLHRPLGGSMTLWGAFERCLAQSFRVLSFDPLGVGRSSDAPLLHATPDMARDAVALLDQLAIPRCHVFGLSLGGMVATCLALQARERVDRLVLASTLPEPLDVSVHGLKLLGSLAACLTRPGVHAELALVRRILSPEFRKTQPERMGEIERAVRETPSKRQNLLVLALAALRHRDLLPRLSGELQILSLFGARDHLTGDKAHAAMRSELAHVRVELVPDSGHDLSLEQPVDSARRVTAFLRRSNRDA